MIKLKTSLASPSTMSMMLNYLWRQCMMLIKMKFEFMMRKLNFTFKKENTYSECTQSGSVVSVNKFDEKDEVSSSQDMSELESMDKKINGEFNYLANFHGCINNEPLDRGRCAN